MENKNTRIPCDIYQTWYTKNLPVKMKNRVELLKKQNPEFKFHLFDDNDCREFIKEHFRPDVLYAFDSLIPGAYKADLWRYCVLFIKGGIYLDIRLICMNHFKLIDLTDKNHFVNGKSAFTIFNAFMSCEKGNMFLYAAIRQIVKNVTNKYYGHNSLYPTGPKMLGLLMKSGRYNINVDLFHYKDGGYIIYKNKFVISTEYPEYNDERQNTYNSIKTERYGKLWDKRQIYKV